MYILHMHLLNVHFGLRLGCRKLNSSGSVLHRTMVDTQMKAVRLTRALRHRCATVERLPHMEKDSVVDLNPALGQMMAALDEAQQAGAEQSALQEAVRLSERVKPVHVTVRRFNGTHLEVCVRSLDDLRERVAEHLGVRSDWVRLHQYTYHIHLNSHCQFVHRCAVLHACTGQRFERAYPRGGCSVCPSLCSFACLYRPEVRACIPKVMSRWHRPSKSSSRPAPV